MANGRTLDDLLGQPLDAVDPLDDYFNTDNIGPDLSGGGVNFDLFEEPENVPMFEAGDRNAAIGFLGQTLWNFADTGLFGVPSLLMPEDIEKQMQPETIAGKVGAAIGGTAGFIGGAPVRVGAKLTTMAAKPFIKKAGQETGGEAPVRGRAADDRQGGCRGQL